MVAREEAREMERQSAEAVVGRRSTEALQWLSTKHDRERRAARLQVERLRHDNERVLVALMAGEGLVR
jgi:hypothetical protein